MMIRTGDHIARLGSVVSALSSAVTATSCPTIPVDDASLFTVGRRYLIGTEVVQVEGAFAATDNLTTTRAFRSAAAAHAVDADVWEVVDLFAVVTASSVAGLLAPLRACETFVALPQVLSIAEQEAAAQAQAGTILRGSYQDDAGDQVTVEQQGLQLNTRLGLVILPRSEGGHWELGVQRA